MNNIFLKFHEYFKNRKLLLLGFLVLLLSILLFFSLGLNLEEDISKLVPQSEKTRTLNKVLRNTDFSDKIIVNISISTEGTADDLTSYATEIIDSIQTTCGDFILNIQGEIPQENIVETMDFVYANLPLFLTDDDYTYLKQLIVPDSISILVQNNYKMLITPSGFIAKQTIRKDPFGLTFRALNKLNKLKISNNFEIYNDFLVTKNKKNLLLFIKPKLPTNETDSNREFVKKLYAISEHLNNKYIRLAKSEYFGSTVIAVSNAIKLKMI